MGKKMIAYLITDYGKMRVPSDVMFPNETLEKDAFSKWYRHQTARAKHAWRVGRSAPSANDGGW